MSCSQNPKIMFTNISSNVPQKSLKIKVDNDSNNNASSKDLTNQVSMEDYYQGGSSIAIPFTWESQPGTPKIKFRENPLPPLTPPPSYFCNTPKRTTKKKYSKPNNKNIFNNIFSKRTSTRKSSLPVSHASSSSSSSSYSTSSSSFSRSMPSSPRVTVISRSQVRHGISSPRKFFDSRMMTELDEEENKCKSPVSTLCFGIDRGANGRSRGFYASMIKYSINGIGSSIICWM